MENSKTKLYNVFKTNKPIIGMIHLKGGSELKILERAKREIDIMINNGVTAVLVENYFADEHAVKMVLRYLSMRYDNLIYGVNILNRSPLEPPHYLPNVDYIDKDYYLAEMYGAKFIQIDSIVGHLEPKKDGVFGHLINNIRAFTHESSNILLLGGVRFKYQPYESKRTLEEDLKIGMDRCDAIVVTGDGKGKETSLDKIKEFRRIIGNFPLVVGAGLTADNCYEQLEIADAGIVGSYLKDNYKDDGEVSPEHVKEFMGKVKTLRKVR